MEYEVIEFTTRSIMFMVLGGIAGALCGAAYAFTEASMKAGEDQ